MKPEAPSMLFLPDDAATARLGAALAALWRKGDVIFLQGGLGAGKSALARAAIRVALGDAGRDAPIPSPTFTLMQPYEADGLRIAHYDLYRLSEPEEALELGIEDAFEEGVSLIEWPERLAHLAPEARLEIALTIPPEGAGRKAAIIGRGGRFKRMAAALAGRA